ncbi:guanylate kinase [soil metagenome]
MRVVEDLGADILNERADELIDQMRQVRRPRLFIISGPSGVGKDAVIERMREAHPDFHYVVTATTRRSRPGEIDGIHYYFMTEAEFVAQHEQDGFLEAAIVYGNWYGVPKGRIRSAFQSGKSVVVKVDVQGSATIRQAIPDSVLIFLVPPSMSELLGRLRSRKTDDPDVLMQRLSTATRELAAAKSFDYVVFNESDQLDDTVNQISAIIVAESSRMEQHEITV